MNRKISRYVAGVVNIEDGYCWDNVYLALSQLRWLRAGKYCEGWAVKAAEVRGGKVLSYHPPVPHGWIELPDGDIIDPTWLASSAVHYFPSLKLTWAELAEIDRLALPVGAFNESDKARVRAWDFLRCQHLSLFA